MGFPRAPASGELHANFSLKLTGGRLRLYNGGVPCELVSAFDPLPASQPGLSYGLNASATFTDPAPPAGRSFYRVRFGH